MTAASNERAAAIAALVLGTTPQDKGSDAAPQLERTGRDVYAGGDEARLLIARASTLGYVKAGVYHRAEAVPGDVVLLTKKQAARLDALGVTVSPEADLEDTLEEVEETGYTDEQLASMGAADLVTYVGQHPDQAPRVRELELAKRETKQRSSVLDATDPELLEAARLEAEEEGDAGQQDPAAVHGPTAGEVAEEQQDNDAPGAGNN